MAAFADLRFEATSLNRGEAPQTKKGTQGSEEVCLVSAAEAGLSRPVQHKVGVLGTPIRTTTSIRSSISSTNRSVRMRSTEIFGEARTRSRQTGLTWDGPTRAGRSPARRLPVRRGRPSTPLQPHQLRPRCAGLLRTGSAPLRLGIGLRAERIAFCSRQSPLMSFAISLSRRSASAKRHLSLSEKDSAERCFQSVGATGQLLSLVGSQLRLNNLKHTLSTNDARQGQRHSIFGQI